MRRMVMLLALALAAVAAVLVVACGSSAKPIDSDGGDSAAAQPTAIARGSGLDRPALQRAVVDEPPDMEVSIDSCTWAANEADGPVELNVTFTVVRLGPESLFATYRVADSNNPSQVYKPPGSKANLTAYPDAPATESLSTTKFEVGTEGLELIISGQRRKTVKFPLDACTGP